MYNTKATTATTMDHNRTNVETVSASYHVVGSLARLVRPGPSAFASRTPSIRDQFLYGKLREWHTEAVKVLKGF